MRFKSYIDPIHRKLSVSLVVTIKAKSPGLLSVRGWWVRRYELGDQGELAAGDWRLTGFPHTAVLHVLCLAVCTVSVAHWVISKS